MGGSRFSVERLARAALFLAVAAGLLVPAALGAIHLADTVIDTLAAGLIPGVRRDFALLVLVLAVLITAARRWPWGNRSFVLAALAGAVAVKLAYVYHVRMVALSDFGAYWNLAGQIADSGVGPVLAEPAGMKRIFLERILPYFLPLRLLFGGGALAYAVPNVLVEAVVGYVVYRFTRGWFGPTAARIALVISLAAIEPLMAAAIPSHDVPGTLFLFLAWAAFFTLLRSLERDGSPVRQLLWSLGFGLLTVVIGLQRTTGPFLLICCGGVGLAALLFGPVGEHFRSRRPLLRAAFLLLILPLGIYLGSNALLVRMGITIPGETFAARRGMVTASGTDSWGSGAWDHFEYEYHVRYAAVPLDWYRFAALKLASDTYYSPGARLSVYLRKARLLFDLGSQTFFYLHGGHFADGRPIEGYQELQMVFLSRGFGLFLLVSLLAGAYRLWSLPHPPWTAFLPLAYVAELSLLLILFGLIQPRYLYPLWPIGAMYAGYFWSGREEAR
jgi:hypothetical protein